MSVSGQQLTRTGRQDMSPPANQNEAALRRQSTAGNAQAVPKGTAQVPDRGIGALGRRLRAAQSIDGRRQLGPTDNR